MTGQPTEKGQGERKSLFRETILIAAGLVILVILKVGGSVVGPLLFFLFIAILLIPLYNYLKTKLSSVFALVVVLLGITAVLLGLGLLVIASFGKLVGSLAQYNQDFFTNMDPVFQKMEAVKLDPETVKQVGQALFDAISGMIKNLVNSTVSIIGGLTMALVAMAFIMLESDSIHRRLEKGLGDSSEVLQRMRLFQRSLVSYVVARLKLNFLTGLGVLIMLLLFGVDFAWLWGLMAFLLSFIPYIGLFVAAIPAVLLGIAESGITIGVILGIGYFVINQIIEQIVEPKVVGSEMKLSPTIMLFSVIFSTWLLGPIGAMLAGPLVALVTIVFSAFDETRWLAILFSSENSPLVTGEEIGRVDSGN